MEVLDICILLVSAFISLSLAGHHCEKNSDCKSCTNSRGWIGQTCLWCPLDLNCHDYVSILNPCLKEQNVRKPSMCQQREHGKYNQTTAFSNVLMSAAAYADDPQNCLKKIYPKTDFQIKAVITKSCEDLPLFKYAKCLAYTAVSHEQRIILLAFRGTLVNNSQIYDELLSVLAMPKTSFPAGGRVQSYYANAHEKLYQGVNASVTYLVKTYPMYDVVVTGHSLGGALASLAAMSLVYLKTVPVSRISLYTYGLPRVGDKEYAFNHDKLVNNSWRIVHHRDIVSHLPTCNLIAGCSVTTEGPYHHGTEIFYPEVTMNVESQYIECHGDEDMNCSDGLVTKKPCTVDISKCIDDHKHYFGLHVGTICQNS